MKKILILLSMSILSFTACGSGTGTVHPTLRASNATFAAPAYAAAAATDTTASAGVEKIVLTITEISAHLAGDAGDDDAGGDDDYTGWLVLSRETVQVDLMAVLAGDVAVLDAVELDEGKYTQIRMAVKSGTITVDGATHAITVPSDKLKLTSTLDIEADTEYNLILDFDVAKSVVHTGNDTWKLQPTIKVSLQEAE